MGEGILKLLFGTEGVRVKWLALKRFLNESEVPQKKIKKMREARFAAPNTPVGNLLLLPLPGPSQALSRALSPPCCEDKATLTQR